MNKENLVFPISLNDFSVFQGSGIGRSMTADERAAIEAWIPVINDFYQEGVACDKKGITAGVEKMDKLISAHSSDAILNKFLQSMRRWVIYAWDRGRKNAEKAVSA